MRFSLWKLMFLVGAISCGAGSWLALLDQELIRGFCLGSSGLCLMTALFMDGTETISSLRSHDDDAAGEDDLTG